MHALHVVPTCTDPCVGHWAGHERGAVPHRGAAAVPVHARHRVERRPLHLTWCLAVLSDAAVLPNCQAPQLTPLCELSI